MNRREAIKRLTLIMGGAVIGAETFLHGGALSGKQSTLSLTPGEIALLDEIGETIIPTTTTPGAKAVQIGAFMQMMVNDCYDEENQAIFQRGIGEIDAAARRKNGRSFLDSSPVERTALLNELNVEERQYRENGPEAQPAHYFRIMKQLTLLGYFTSEIGSTQALRYIEVPGAYRGNEPYKKGDRAWFVPPGRDL